MSKCSALSTCQLNLWYSTLLRRKYWAETPPGRQASRAAAAASRIAVRGKKDGRDIEPPFRPIDLLKTSIVFKTGAVSHPCAKLPRRDAGLTRRILLRPPRMPGHPHPGR